MPLQLEITDLESSDRIVTLNAAEHFPLMQERFPSWFGASDPCRIEYWHVHDIDRMAPEEGLPLITEQLQRLMEVALQQKPGTARAACSGASALWHTMRRR
jgi:protein-tyrosine phosphatase